MNEELEDSGMFQLTEVLDRVYSSIPVKEVVSQQTHLNKEEQATQERVPAKYSTIFDGKYPQQEDQIEETICYTISLGTCLHEGDGWRWCHLKEPRGIGMGVTNICGS